MAAISIYGGMWYDDHCLGNLNVNLAYDSINQSYTGGYAIQFGSHQLSGPIIAAKANDDIVGIIPIHPPLFFTLTNASRFKSGGFTYKNRHGSISALLQPAVQKDRKYAPLALASEKAKIRPVFCTIM